MTASGVFARARAVIDLEALRHNFKQARRLAGSGVEIWPAVKANAYGHGAVQVTAALAEAGADGFCVATPMEAVEITSSAQGRSVLVLGVICPDEIPSVLECGAEVTIASLDLARRVSAQARAAGRTVHAHLKMDTGMGRIGFRPEEAADAAEAIDRLPGLALRGIMTHYACADSADLSNAQRQTEVFAEVSQAATARAGRPLLRHAANSAALLAMPQSRFDAVRPGIMLYGSCPSETLAGSADLRGVMTLSAPVVFLKDVLPGTPISYGHTWRAERPSRIATVAIGYGDGLPRRLSSAGSAVVRGTAAPIAGRICMDQTMLDVTDVPEVAVGDEAVFWGGQGHAGNRCDGVAWSIGTIPYELTCQVTPRVPRIYVQ